MLRDGRVIAASAIIGVLLLAALAAGWTQYRQLASQRDAATAAARRHWVTQGPKNAHSAAHYGLYVFKPQQPLSAFDRGVDPYTGTFTWLEAHKQDDFKYRPAQDATALARFGDWTAASVLQLLLPIVIIMVVFPAIVGERESGTLRQLLGSGASAREVVLGKALGIAGGLGFLIVPAAIVGALALALAAPAGIGGGIWPRAALIAVTYIGYFAIYLTVGLLVSSRARTARAALIILLAFWGINAVIAPRAVAELARQLRPTPSALDFNLAVERELADARSAGASLEDSVMRAYGVRSVDSLPFNFAGLSLQASEEHGYEIFDRHYGKVMATLRAQDRIGATGAIIAPLIAVRSLSMAFAGTDIEQHHRFAQAAEAYRRTLVETMNESLLGVRAGTDAFATSADSTLWRRLPPFSYESLPLARTISSYASSILVLGVWVVVAGLALFAWSGRLMTEKSS